MVSAALLLCLLSTGAGASRINGVLGRDAPDNGILLDEAGVAAPQNPGRDRALTAESSALLDITGTHGNNPLPRTPLPHDRELMSPMPGRRVASARAAVADPLPRTPPSEAPMSPKPTGITPHDRIAGMKCEGNEHWKTGVRWTTGFSLGSGSNGQVLQVTASNANQSQQYAIKISLLGNQTSAQEIDNEAIIMQATTAFFRTGRHPECQHVAPVVDSRPCLDGVLILTGAYVTLKMEMDLQQWFENYARGNRLVSKRCQGTIARQLAGGLSCLHTAGSHGFMHGDFKTDNVLVESIHPKTKCPQGLRLIDFGLSFALGSVVNKYDESYFEDAGHLPGTLFEGAPDALNLTVEANPDMFYASSDVDWCSYVYLMNTMFHYNPIQQAFDIARVARCGKMGYGRRIVQRLGLRAGTDIEGGMDVQGDSRASWAAWSKARSASASSAGLKRRREEAKEVERVVAQRALAPSVWGSAATLIASAVANGSSANLLLALAQN